MKKLYILILFVFLLLNIITVNANLSKDNIYSSIKNLFYELESKGYISIYDKKTYIKTYYTDIYNTGINPNSVYKNAKIKYNNIIQTNPVKTNPVKTNPVKTNPVKTNPVKINPVKTNPVKTNPVKTNIYIKYGVEYYKIKIKSILKSRLKSISNKKLNIILIRIEKIKIRYYKGSKKYNQFTALYSLINDELNSRFNLINFDNLFK